MKVTSVPAEDVGFELNLLLTFYLARALASMKRVVSRRLDAVRRRFVTSGAGKMPHVHAWLVRQPCRSHPLVGEPVTGQRGDLLEVLVIMQHRGPVTFGDSADEQIGGGQGAVIAPPYCLLAQVECTGPRLVIAGQVVEA